MKHVRRLLWAMVETVWFTLVLIALILWLLPDLWPRRNRK